ncbi:DUF6476 family protein [Tateyamaria sp. ANG-S1]|uniref:DUF6476 family protein n=1 Tax=Tateyamaria sp. ANG-S1 TaxID=1577905 RepID=UPI00057EAAAA|nr:DUF6476 family protein [Tateyamaria sp. ANG-S1]KIC46159.1 hypothetical protein RA29_20255 [Tateyamaria sp. ANG-S1]
MDTPELPANLTFLRRLVTVLTIIMIGGVVTVVALLVIRLNADPALLPLPDQVTLPGGTRATAFTIGSDWYAVVTEDDQILIFDQVTGTLRQTIDVQTAAD